MLNLSPGSRAGKTERFFTSLTDSLVGVCAPLAQYSSLPNGWLYCAGQNVSRAKYPKLFAKLNKLKSLSIFDNIGNRVFFLNPHGLSVNDPILFRTLTGGVLPTGLTAGQIYYVSTVGGTDNITIATTPGGGDFNFTSNGTQPCIALVSPFGDGDGSTTFTLPDLRGRIIVHKDNMGGSAAGRLGLADPAGILGTVLGSVGGEEAHLLLLSEIIAHTHTIAHTHAPSGGGNFRAQIGTATIAQTTGTNFGADTATGQPSSANTGNAGGDTPHNNVQPTIVMNYGIFTGNLNA